MGSTQIESQNFQRRIVDPNEVEVKRVMGIRLIPNTRYVIANQSQIKKTVGEHPVQRYYVDKNDVFFVGEYVRPDYETKAKDPFGVCDIFRDAEGKEVSIEINTLGDYVGEETVVPKVPTFEYMDNGDRIMMKTAYDAVVKLGYWDKIEDINENWFEFRMSPIKESISGEISKIYDGHSGSSFASIMNQVQRFKEVGEDHYRFLYLENRLKVKARMAELEKRNCAWM